MWRRDMEINAFFSKSKGYFLKTFLEIPNGIPSKYPIDNPLYINKKQKVTLLITV